MPASETVVEASWASFLLPTTAQGVNIWMFWCIVLYLAVSWVSGGVNGKGWGRNPGIWINKAFGGANLGVCTLLTPSLLRNDMITLLGQAPLYLTIAGFTGVILSIAQMRD